MWGGSDPPFLKTPLSPGALVVFPGPAAGPEAIPEPFLFLPQAAAVTKGSGPWTDGAWSPGSRCGEGGVLAVGAGLPLLQ